MDAGRQQVLAGCGLVRAIADEQQELPAGFEDLEVAERGVGGVDTALAIHGDALRSGELSYLRTHAPEGPDELAGRLEHLHAEVPAVDHVQVAVRPERDVTRQVELARLGAARPDVVEMLSIDAVEHADAVVAVLDGAGVDDVETITLRRDGHVRDVLEELRAAEAREVMALGVVLHDAEQAAVHDVEIAVAIGGEAERLLQGAGLVVTDAEVPPPGMIEHHHAPTHRIADGHDAAAHRDIERLRQRLAGLALAGEHATHAVLARLGRDLPAAHQRALVDEARFLGRWRIRGRWLDGLRPVGSGRASDERRDDHRHRQSCSSRQHGA